LGLALAWYPSTGLAQPPPAEEEEELEEEVEEEVEEEEIEDEELEEPSLRPPSIDQLQIEGVESAQEDEEVQEEVAEDEFPDPGDAAEELEEAAPPSSDPTRADWTAPQPVLTLHGYFRVRSELWDTFWLGRDPDYLDGTDLPFSQFRPVDIPGGGAPMGGCGDTGSPESTSGCDTETIGFANMRLRLAPTISLSDDVRVHAMFDVLDNLVLGSTPDGLVTEPGMDAVAFERVERTPRVPLDSFTTSVAPPQRYRNSLSDSIVARRAWAEVTNRGLGQLRFGRMGSHWGLGLLANGGEGIDADYQSDVDRIMGITKLAGFYLVAAWDFANEGFVNYNIRDPQALAYDINQEDDVDQYVFAVARRMDEEDQRAALQRGEAVLNAGAYFVYRNQLLSGAGVRDWYGPTPDIGAFVRRNAEAFIPDLWVQFLYQGLRIEAEAVLIAGTIENTNNSSYVLEDYDVLQFGAVLEVEYRLLDDKLGIYFDSGFATGDADVEGLAITAGLPAQNGGDRTISTFRFHPNYRVDMILWRNIMYQVSGAYYFKPGLSYDFIRNTFGQLFGARADVVWSRATSPVQTWGNDPDLGIEINARLYYRSEDGPELIDGFYGSLEYGILFPLGGLGYLTRANGLDDRGMTPPELENAQNLRLVLGVQY
jgi:uncharacterized protein (TIGR04551 family)